MINATYNGQTYSDVNTMIATDGSNSATVTLYESGVVPTPTGTKSITENGTGIDVTSYAAVDVNVPTDTTPTGTKQISITQNGTTTEDVTNYASAEITVSVSGGATPTGTINISGNGVFDVTNYSSANVNVSGGLTATDVATGNFPAHLEIPHIHTVTRSYCFANSSTIESITYLADETGGTSLFRGCVNLRTFVAPNLLVLSATSCFEGCTSLEAVDLPAVFHGGISTRVFADCSSLDTLVIRQNNQVIGLGNVANVSGTPFAANGTGGIVYIPKAMYDHLGDGTNMDYNSASNWSTLVAAGTVSFAQIEGSAYETAYVDGTPISS